MAECQRWKNPRLPSRRDLGGEENNGSILIQGKLRVIIIPYLPALRVSLEWVRPSSIKEVGASHCVQETSIPVPAQLCCEKNLTLSSGLKAQTSKIPLVDGLSTCLD